MDCSTFYIPEMLALATEPSGTCWRSRQGSWKRGRLVQNTLFKPVKEIQGKQQNETKPLSTSLEAIVSRSTLLTYPLCGFGCAPEV